MRKTLFTVMFFVVAMFVALNCAAQDQDLQTFTLKIDGKDAAVNLPKEVPDMANAKFITDRCYDAHLCADHYAVNEEETLIMTFWHHKGEVIGFVLHEIMQTITEHTPWLYADSTPTLATSDEFNTRLTELYQGG